ncbi:formate dehydrogenase accessory sulfurtransferase FdhD [Rubellimicrobium sp. CFH 75288]|uniref:formate dehydrogenase accessory sulfurtransferase FdhD n=1 Tax=Rubellimicrobium sp. CFH 75288 TaxID=2697034 RepID=UPI00141304BD|nr:formate dehydrogenase accessory sulfurtransferase FdhD [Rubellimicrobium sp. CFH 75288]NAZ38138.1 formate dehydrogenase accessory sulfurtransferase FdhD [Rubellimicrobium sp. CFH 75288]
MIPAAAPTALIRAAAPEKAEGRGEVRRALPEETPVALVYNGGTQAVMMATPADIEDFAWGFTLTEGIAPPDLLPPVEVVAHDAPTGPAIEARMWLPPEAEAALRARRRASVGPVGCGLCGIDSLQQALRPLPPLPEAHVALTVAEVRFALGELRDWQPLHDETRAVHAAGFWRPGDGVLLAREDVGRHNALDKLVGAMRRGRIDPAMGAIAVTSRLSVEMVQKAVMAGTPILIAVSAPTAHAVRLAEAANLTLASLSRGEVHVFTHPRRILLRRPRARGGR